MRKVAIILASVLIAGTAGAATKDEGWSFGGADCTAPTECDILRGNLEGVISIANSCVAHQGYSTGSDGAFDVSRGLDSNDCLTTKEIKSERKAMVVTPKCCITKDDRDLCHVMCSFLGTK